MSLPIIFVHGSGGSADSWYYQTRHLPNSTALTLPGHSAGLSRPPAVPVPAEPCPDVACNAAYLAEYIEEQGYAVGTLVTIGHSLGGAVVMQHALQHSAQLAGLVLVGTGARLRVLPSLLQELADDYPAAVESLLSNYFGKEADPALVEGTRRKLLRLPNRVTLADFAACNEFDLMSEVTNIKLPTLLIFGSGDPLTPPKYGEWLQQHLPHARLAIIPSEGHLFPVTHYSEFNQLVAEFVAELEASR